VAPPARPAVDGLALGAALLTVVLWASAFVGIRAVAPELSPGSIALGRLAIGSIALGALVAFRGWRRPSRRALILIVASGVSWFAVYNLALNAAERIVDAGTASMLVNTGPIFIAIFAGLFLGEGLPGRLLLGCVVAFGGSVLIGVASSGDAALGGDAVFGIVLCVTAALAYAVGVTLQKPALDEISALQLTWMACLTGAIVCLPFAPTLVSELGRADGTTLGWLAYLGIFPTSLAFTVWAFALRRSSAGRLGSTTYLVPPVAIVLGWLLLHEAPPTLAFAGGVLCIGGVIVARSSGSFVRRRAAEASLPEA
jgi:drug/metabolite transporter (DMT)-like permease